VATVKPPNTFDAADAEPPAVVLDGSLFFLDPPLRASGSNEGGSAVLGGFSALYRVTPKARG
jgi:hypothetical protein